MPRCGRVQRDRLRTSRLPPPPASIEFRSLRKEYHGRRLIDTLSLKIEAKERVVLSAARFPGRGSHDATKGGEVIDLRPDGPCNCGGVFVARAMVPDGRLAIVYCDCDLQVIPGATNSIKHQLSMIQLL